MSDDAPEVVMSEELVALKPHEQAIINAAEAAMSQENIPGREEFLALAMMARVLSMSSIVPRDLRGRPADVFVILLTGRDLGIPMTTALRKIYVIDGQPSIAPQLLNARIRQLGLGQIVPGPRDANRAVAIAVGPGGRVDPRCRISWPSHHDGCHCAEILGDTEFTMAEARTAGLATKANWKAYGTRMLWWRCSGYAADDYFPEASLGLYSPDELGAMTDPDGNPIDPNSIALPEGYEQAKKAIHQEEPADPLLLLDVGLRIRTLPEDLQEEMRTGWRERELPKTRYLTPTKLKVVQPWLKSLEQRAATDEAWDQETRYFDQLEEFMLAHCPNDLPEPVSVPQTPEVAQEVPEPVAEATEPPEPPEPTILPPSAPPFAGPLVTTTAEEPCPFCEHHPCDCLGPQVDTDPERPF